MVSSAHLKHNMSYESYVDLPEEGKDVGALEEDVGQGPAVLGSLPVVPSSQHSGEDKETSHSLFY